MRTDSEIQKNVMEELKWEPFLKACEIGVTVKNGVVTLSGTVDTYAKKLSAENATRKVSGVRAVAEDIEVRINSDDKKNDTEIAEAILNSLKWNCHSFADQIKIKVEDGWITLEGEVEWDFQRNSVKISIENLTGVVGISNNVKVVPGIDPMDIKRRISSAFHRSASVDSQKINIEVEGSKVILRGRVRSYVEKKEAESSAWRAPGVVRVENKLEIDMEEYAY